MRLWAFIGVGSRLNIKQVGDDILDVAYIVYKQLSAMRKLAIMDSCCFVLTIDGLQRDIRHGESVANSQSI